MKGLTGRLARTLSCVRFDEVAALQATPIIGAVFSAGSLSVGHVLIMVLVLAGNICLMAHVFLLNDWSGIDGDLQDTGRAGRTFTAKGVTRHEVGTLAVVLLAVSLTLFGLINAATLFLAAAIAGLGALYSGPALHLKATPFFGSALHFAGGGLHFLLGYAAFGAIDARGFIVGCFFGLVFTAGHLMHETRDYDVDRRNGIRTNAVVFGKTRTFAAGLVLFILAYAFLAGLAGLGYVPFILILAAGFIPLHLWASHRAMTAGLTPESLFRLQRCYHAIFAVIGAGLIVTARFHSFF